MQVRWAQIWRFGWQCASAMLIVLSTHAAQAVAKVENASVPAAPHKILILGDSLSAAYGISLASGWVALAAAQLDAKRWRVVNASVSGETTAGGLARLPAALQSHRPHIVVIELGANDGLRGLPTKQMQQNLSAMIQQSQAVGAKVLLIGIRLPPNLGATFNQQFDNVFLALQRQYQVGYLANLLEPILHDRAMYQDDNLHPIAKAQPLLTKHVLKALTPMLEKLH